jgi:hypothetical protein
MTIFPASLDTFLNPAAGTTMDAAGYEHDVQHANLNDAVAALQAKVGIDDSTDAGSLDKRVAVLETFFETVVSIGSGVTSGTVTGLALPFTPTKLQLTMLIPDGGLLILVAAGSAPTADGFSWLLTGTTDSANYKIFARLT